MAPSSSKPGKPENRTNPRDATSLVSSRRKTGEKEEGNGSDYQVESVKVENSESAVSFYAGGSHAEPAWVVTSKFRWTGSQFTRIGIERKRFTGWPKRS